MKYYRTSYGIIATDIENPKGSFMEDVILESENITDLLMIGDIGTSKFGTVFMYKEPSRKEEFLKLCDKLNAKRKRGDFIVFCEKVDGIWKDKLL